MIRFSVFDAADWLYPDSGHSMHTEIRLLPRPCRAVIPAASHRGKRKHIRHVNDYHKL